MADFGKRDIALYISDEVGDAASLKLMNDGTADEIEGMKPKLDPTKKVTRYWPGKAPKWVEEEEEVEKDIKDIVLERRKQREQEEAILQNAKNDPRLARLQKATRSTNKERSVARARERHSRIVQEAEVVQNAADSDSEEEGGYQPVPGDVLLPQEEDEEEDEDEEEIAARRDRIRERMRQRAKEKEQQEHLAGGKEEDEEESGSGSDSSEWETDTDEESEDEEGQILKPIFVPSHQRETIREAERQQAAEAGKKKKAAAAREEEKRRTRDMIAQIVRKEESAVDVHLDGNGSEDGLGVPDDRDDLDEALEYEAWKVRELQRIQRDAGERQRLEEEKRETARRRGLTDEQRRLEDRAAGKGQEAPKAKWKFMQKYYHKGVFYMDEESMEQNDVRRREYDDATLEDKFDKAALPSVMQVKKFGRSGQTKYTHLVDQDTTQFDAAWAQPGVRTEQYNQKMSGVGDDLDSAGRKRKKPQQG
mmetsp:Transcript_7065/g.10608  ORF Transcript_7065/g.10608 Transcript_7065/m.10608 type:complete len:478 (+) Transcript_7065:144-1577(+)